MGCQSPCCCGLSGAWLVEPFECPWTTNHFARGSPKSSVPSLSHLAQVKSQNHRNASQRRTVESGLLRFSDCRFKAYRKLAPTSTCKRIVLRQRTCWCQWRERINKSRTPLVWFRSYIGSRIVDQTIETIALDRWVWNSPLGVLHSEVFLLIHRSNEIHLASSTASGSLVPVRPHWLLVRTDEWHQLVTRSPGFSW